MEIVRQRDLNVVGHVETTINMWRLRTQHALMWKYMGWVSAIATMVTNLELDSELQSAHVRLSLEKSIVLEYLQNLQDCMIDQLSVREENFSFSRAVGCLPTPPPPLNSYAGQLYIKVENSIVHVSCMGQKIYQMYSVVERSVEILHELSNYFSVWGHRDKTQWPHFVTICLQFEAQEVPDIDVMYQLHCELQTMAALLLPQSHYLIVPALEA